MGNVKSKTAVKSFVIQLNKFGLIKEGDDNHETLMQLESVFDLKEKENIKRAYNIATAERRIPSKINSTGKSYVEKEFE